MLIPAWIIFIGASVQLALSFIASFNSRIKTAWFYLIIYFELFLVALSAGVIWGGLFR